LLAEIDIRDSDWRVGNYQILEEIGRGGMGVIYRARQRHSKRIVALKRVLSYHGDSRETLERFRREAEAAASLDHPNILPIYEVGEHDGLPFFTMKYAAGGSLQQAGAALSAEPRECVRLLAKVTRAVGYAHGQGILHRDLKPGNILLDARAEPMVTDFGLAKWMDANSDLTRSLAVFGTPGFIAPEQAQGPGADLTPAADIYSLGAILFDLLTGRPPFLGEHALAVIRQAAETTAPKLRSINRSLGRDLETICAKCLEREAGARYHSASDLAEDLERWLDGRPIVARPVSPPVALARWSRRNPVLATAGAGCVLLAAFATVQVISSSRLGSIVRDAEVARHSVVIAPFEDFDELSTSSAAAREATEAFVRGLQHEQGLRVSSAASAAGELTDLWKAEDWRSLCAKAGAREILTGSVRTRNGGRRVVLRVIDGASGNIVRKKVCDLSVGPAGYGAAVATAAAELRASLDGESRDEKEARAAKSESRSTAREYLRAGKEYYYRFTPADIKTSIPYFTKAVEADPQWAEAQAMFSIALSRRFQQVPEERTDERFAQAMAAAEKAISLAPETALGYRALAGLLQDRDVAGLQEAALCALELDPDETTPAAWIGYGWRMRGRPDLALRWVQRSTGRNARPGMNASIIGDCYTELDQDDMAAKFYRQHQEFWPDVPDGHVGLARLEMFHGDFAAARRTCEEALARYSSHFYARQMLAVVKFLGRDLDGAEAEYGKLVQIDRPGGTTFYCAISNLSALGTLRLLRGDAEQGKALLAEALDNANKASSQWPANHDFFYELAGIYAALGERDASFQALERGIAAGWLDYRTLELDPRFDSVRDDERYAERLAAVRRTVADLRKGKPPMGELASTEDKTRWPSRYGAN
jgi:TolB-like protein/tRNA A-37 threonylcarbamoyl transferase component Bud32/Tfp pilus assembly protein PilF